MFSRTAFHCLSWLCLVAFCYGERAAADVIKWDLKKDDQLAVTISTKSIILTEVNRTKIEIELNLGYEMDWTVLEIKSNGNAIIEQSFTRMSVRLARTKKETIVYDTSKKTELIDNAKPYADVYDKLVGLKFKVEWTPQGEIVKVDLSNKDIATIRKIPESMQARQLFEKRGLVEVLNSGGFILPAKELKVGESWEVDKKRKMTFGTASVKNGYSFAGVDGNGIATFDVKATATLEDQPKNPAEKPLQLKKQEQTGKIVFDMKNGLMKSITLSQHLETEKPYRELKILTDSRTDTNIQFSKK